MISQEKTKKIRKLAKDLWVKYESKIILATGIILVAILAFEAGILQGQKWQQKPLIIEKPVQTRIITPESQTPSQAPNSTPENQNQTKTTTTNATSENQKQSATTNIIPQDCALVGSKNSTKYHLPTCQWAKRIKPENLVCFKNEEEAKSKGYTPCSSCIK